MHYRIVPRLFMLLLYTLLFMLVVYAVVEKELIFVHLLTVLLRCLF